MEESRRSDLARAAGGWRGSGEAPFPFLESKGREDAETEPASAWIGVKKPKIQSTPTTPGPGDLDDTKRSSGEIAHGQDQEQEQEQIEGLDWDVVKLSKEIDGLRRWMQDSSDDEDCDDELCAHFNEEQQTALNQRLALCRIRADEKEYRVLDNASLLKIFPPDVLEHNLYYRRYECHFDWFFDPEYCKACSCGGLPAHGASCYFILKLRDDEPCACARKWKVSCLVYSVDH